MTDRHQAPSYPLRMPTELREQMEKAALAAGRSMNAEIVARLQQSFVPRTELTRAEVLAVVKATVEELARRKGR
jgi:hypothetical protein